MVYSTQLNFSFINGFFYSILEPHIYIYMYTPDTIIIITGNGWNGLWRIHLATGTPGCQNSTDHIFFLQLSLKRVPQRTLLTHSTIPLISAPTKNQCIRRQSPSAELSKQAHAVHLCGQSVWIRLKSCSRCTIKDTISHGLDRIMA